MKRKLLFISHSEKDSVIVSHFIDLLFDIGLKKENMFCSSRTDIGIPVKEDIFEYLRQTLDSDDVITIFILSENYYASPACLNEMGAVWIKQSDYYTFLLPDFDFRDIKGAINPNKKGIKLSVDDTKLQGELNNFKSQIESKFSIKNSDRIDQNRWEKQRNQFINHMKNYSSELIIYLANYRDYCINEVNYGGCMADYDKTTNILTASYDFSKTDTQICSVVLFVGEINALTKYEKNKNLQFSLQANSEFQITVEMKLIHQDVQYKINATQEWADYSIPLQEFRGAKDNWKKLTEIKFLAYRKDINKGTIRIKDLRII